MDFKLITDYKPTGDQPKAIETLTSGIEKGLPHQVLLGVTGSGKTFTVANVIEKINRPTLVISHNKTLAAQLYQEFRDFFPQNAVSYFVSYYDYYQPEAYIPSTDTYIEKETQINEEIDKLRLAATTNLLTRKDVIVVASVSCIYNIGSPIEYGRSILELAVGLKIDRQQILTRLTELQYVRSDFSFHRGTFRVRGELIDVIPAYEDTALRIEMDGQFITSITKLDPLTGKPIEENPEENKSHSDITKPLPPGSYKSVVIYPAKHYMADTKNKREIFTQIQEDLADRVKELKSQGKELEAHRLSQKVNYDLEMMEEVGYVNGIENYSRYFDGRKPGDAPYSLLEYFPKDYLLVIDESHITIPQVRGMYHGDRSRKETLINFGFRLPAALDNRPLKFDEFLRRMGQTIYTSATPDEWEINMATSTGSQREAIVEQLIRPTGLIDPTISVRPTQGQIDDLVKEIKIRKEKGERVLVTTLTKRLAEDLSDYLASPEKSGIEIKVQYLHSDVDTLDRVDILGDLRRGKYDVIVGINLLREGLDLPEVSLVAILDADKQGFLRSRTSLVQTMGRAARHVHGQVIMYADEVTQAMKAAMDEVERRRQIQLDYNIKHGITPQSIQKPIRDKLVERNDIYENEFHRGKNYALSLLDELDPEDMTPDDRQNLVQKLEKSMREQAKLLQFEAAAQLRDKIQEIKEVK
jgi:excinuclease ABC subunit B